MSLYERLGRFMCRRSYTTYRLWFYLAVLPRLLARLPGVAACAAWDSLKDCWWELVEILPHTREDWKDMRGDAP